MTDLLGIIGSVTASSRTRTAVEVALDAASDIHDVETEVVHLAEYDIDTADGRRLADYDGDTAAALEAIVESESYLIGTPVYRASYSGALKNLLDMVPRGIWQADVAPFESSAVGLIATGATPHHHLIIENELRPVMSFFGSYVTGGAYLHDDHFESLNDGYRVDDDEVRKRLSTLGGATVDMSKAITESDDLSALGPQV
jgi:FMN reductase